MEYNNPDNDKSSDFWPPVKARKRRSSWIQFVTACPKFGPKLWSHVISSPHRVLFFGAYIVFYQAKAIYLIRLYRSTTAQTICYKGVYVNLRALSALLLRADSLSRGRFPVLQHYSHRFNRDISVRRGAVAQRLTQNRREKRRTPRMQRRRTRSQKS